MVNIISLHTLVVNSIGSAFNTGKIQNALDSAILEHNSTVDDVVFASGTGPADWVVSDENSSGFISGLAIKILNNLRKAGKRDSTLELLSPTDLVTDDMLQRLTTPDEQNEDEWDFTNVQPSQNAFEGISR